MYTITGNSKIDQPAEEPPYGKTRTRTLGVPKLRRHEWLGEQEEDGQQEERGPGEVERDGESGSTFYSRRRGIPEEIGGGGGEEGGMRTAKM